MADRVAVGLHASRSATELAYGTEKHEDYFVEMGEKAQAGELLSDEIAHLRDELDAMAAKGALPPELRKLRADLDALRRAANGAADAGGDARRWTSCSSGSTRSSSG